MGCTAYWYVVFAQQLGHIFSLLCIAVLDIVAGCGFVVNVIDSSVMDKMFLYLATS